MISPSVIAKAAAYRERFQTAQPFKHVCLDEFFTDEAAEALLRDFPPFDREFARNGVRRIWRQGGGQRDPAHQPLLRRDLSLSAVAGIPVGDVGGYRYRGSARRSNAFRRWNAREHQWPGTRLPCRFQLPARGRLSSAGQSAALPEQG